MMATRNARDTTLEQARELLKHKRFDEARALLLRTDHPLAQQWLDQIEIRRAGQTGELDGLKVRSALGSAPGEDSLYVDDLIRPLDDVRASTLPAFGLALMVFVAGVGGVLLGYGLHLSTSIAYAIVVSAWIAAYLGGIGLRTAVAAGGVRAPRAAFWIGLLMGVLIYGAYRYAGYQELAGALADEPVFPGLAAPSQEALSQTDAALERLVGQPGPFGFVLFTIEAPVLVSVRDEVLLPEGENFTSDDRDLAVGLTLLEVLIVVFTPARMAGNAARARATRYSRRHPLAATGTGARV
jgi:hypothetical protein